MLSTDCQIFLSCLTQTQASENQRAVHNFGHPIYFYGNFVSFYPPIWTIARTMGPPIIIYLSYKSKVSFNNPVLMNSIWMMSLLEMKDLWIINISYCVWMSTKSSYAKQYPLWSWKYEGNGHTISILLKATRQPLWPWSLWSYRMN